MMTRRGAVGLIASGLALLLAGCGDDQFPDYHYKMTVYVGDKAFSSVRAVEQKQGFSAADSSGQAVTRKLQGQAVILDLADGRTVYALIDQRNEPEYAKKVANYALLPLIPEFKRDPRTDNFAVERGTESLNRMADAQQKMVEIEGAQDLPRTRPNPDPYSGPRALDNWPMFVTFGDPKDPKTVREVSPDSIGVKRITIEITDEPVTTGIEERLIWRKGFGSRMLNGERFRNPQDRSLSAYLSSYSFSTESAE